MIPLDGYRTRVQYKGLEGLSQIGFKKHEALLESMRLLAGQLRR
jgi:hypothetical protein